MKVIITPEAEEQYNKLPQSEQLKVRKKLKSLEDNPYMGKKLVGKLKEKRSLRAWPYRIIYEIINNQKTVYIDSVVHRQGVYK